VPICIATPRSPGATARRIWRRSSTTVTLDGEEGDELRRQSQEFAERWGESGDAVEYG